MLTLSNVSNSVTKFAQASLSAICTATSAIPSLKFFVPRFFVLSPACTPHLAYVVCAKPLDRYGEVLMCAHLLFDTWRIRHTSILTVTEAIIMAQPVTSSQPLFSTDEAEAIVKETKIIANIEYQFNAEIKDIKKEIEPVKSLV